MSRRKKSQTATEETTVATENGEMSAVAETSSLHRKTRARKVGGYRAYGSKGADDPFKCIKTTATVGRMRKWFQENRQLIESVYSVFSFERYTVLDENMQPILAD